MVEIDGKILSADIFTRCFCCNIERCMGMCCVEGDSGAPLEDSEIGELERTYPVIEHTLTPRAREEIEHQGLWVRDAEGDKVTPIIDGRECVYAILRPGGVWVCAIEEAWNRGETLFRKPISCHLYPIRVKHFDGFDALNLHHWQVCRSAYKLGGQQGVPVYKFLKEAIIRAWGEDFYNQLKEVAPQVEKLAQEGRI